MQFNGAITALVTPFKDNGKTVDEDAYRAHIEWQIEQGINGLVPCGTTGESATLSHKEHHDVIKMCVGQVNGRVPVLAGAGSNNTMEAIELTRGAKAAGADGALLITPYYNKPTQEGLKAHFKAIADEVSLPFILYNVPGRTSVNLLPETLAEMAREIPEVVGVKEATGDLKQCSDIMELCGMDFQMLSGDDFTALPLLSLGGCGVISVMSNVAPAKSAAMCKAFADKDHCRAQQLHYELMPIARAMFMETNPVPAKTALAEMGIIPSDVCRLPMVPLQQAHKEALIQVLRDSKLL